MKWNTYDCQECLDSKFIYLKFAKSINLNENIKVLSALLNLKLTYIVNILLENCPKVFK